MYFKLLYSSFFKQRLCFTFYMMLPYAVFAQEFLIFLCLNYYTIKTVYSKKTAFLIILLSFAGNNNKVVKDPLIPK